MIHDFYKTILRLIAPALVRHMSSAPFFAGATIIGSNVIAVIRLHPINSSLARGPLGTVPSMNSSPGQLSIHQA
jgi:hypothetical protein